MSVETKCHLGLFQRYVFLLSHIHTHTHTRHHYISLSVTKMVIIRIVAVDADRHLNPTNGSLSSAYTHTHTDNYTFQGHIVSVWQVSMPACLHVSISPLSSNYIFC